MEHSALSLLALGTSVGLEEAVHSGVNLNLTGGRQTETVSGEWGEQKQTCPENRWWREDRKREN